MILVHKRKVGLLAVNIERRGGWGTVTFMWKIRTSSLNWKGGEDLRVGASLAELVVGEGGVMLYGICCGPVKMRGELRVG